MLSVPKRRRMVAAPEYNAAFCEESSIPCTNCLSRFVDTGDFNHICGPQSGAISVECLWCQHCEIPCKWVNNTVQRILYGNVVLARQRLIALRSHISIGPLTKAQQAVYETRLSDFINLCITAPQLRGRGTGARTRPRPSIVTEPLPSSPLGLQSLFEPAAFGEDSTEPVEEASIQHTSEQIAVLTEEIRGLRQSHDALLDRVQTLTDQYAHVHSRDLLPSRQVSFGNPRTIVTPATDASRTEVVVLHDAEGVGSVGEPRKKLLRKVVVKVSTFKHLATD